LGAGGFEAEVHVVVAGVVGGNELPGATGQLVGRAPMSVQLVEVAKVTAGKPLQVAGVSLPGGIAGDCSS
jgi:hypothetical protein